MANQPPVHPFHDIAKPGDIIDWGSWEDYESHAIIVGYDNQLTWADATDSERRVTRDYLKERREVLDAYCAGALSTERCVRELDELDEGFTEDLTWGWGDTSSALDTYAKRML